MPKRTNEEVQKEEEEEESDIDLSSSEDEELKQESEPDMINVDFDFFNLNPKFDFQGAKCFIRQLFQQDTQLLPLSELADLLLSRTEIGSTVKTDGRGGDAFSMLTATDLTDNTKSSNALRKLNSYFLDKTKDKTEFNGLLHQLFSPESKSKLGLVFSERMINMPVETTPPMYRMLLQELSKAGYDFDYFIIPSRVYQIKDSEVDKELGSNEPKAKRVKEDTKPELEYYHDEDEILEKNSLHHGYFEYTKGGINPDARRVFNDYAIVPKLSLILLSKAGLTKAVEEMSATFAP